MADFGPLHIAPLFVQGAVGVSPNIASMGIFDVVDSWEDVFTRSISLS